MPVLLGEWGAYHSKSQQMVKTASHAVGLIEKLNFSNTYWAYYEDIDQYPYFTQSLVRPYPMRISGSLISYHYDRESGVLECSWNESDQIVEPTLIFVPDMNRFSEECIKIKPESDKIYAKAIPESNSGYLLINPVGETKRELTMEFFNPDTGNTTLN
jgi:endoglycosylceramidase